MQNYTYRMQDKEVVDSFGWRKSRCKRGLSALDVGMFVYLKLPRRLMSQYRLIDKKGPVLYLVRNPSLYLSHQRHVQLYLAQHTGHIDSPDKFTVFGDSAVLKAVTPVASVGTGHCACCGTLLEKGEHALRLTFASFQRKGFYFRKTRFGGEWVSTLNIHPHPRSCKAGSKLLWNTMTGDENVRH